MSPTPYEISIPPSRITDLHQRLSLSTFPDEVECSEDRWRYGSPLADIKRLATYWKDGYDWRKAEAELNQIPQYMTEVEVEGYGDVKVHFVHAKSEVVEEAVPLLFVHGWPGSYIEVTKLLPLLTRPTANTPAFHIVAPSLPNFGWSPGVKKPGFAAAQYAETCHKLMLQLGYDKYVTQGGDWGFTITRALGILYPEHCLASHVNMILSAPPKFSQFPLLSLKHAVTPYSEAEKRGLERSDWFAKEGRGYSWEQSTKPQTLGYGLSDSPVALLAWIYEKLHDWTDSYPWTDDEILTWISIYWFSAAGPAASIRIYYEVTHSKDTRVSREKVSRWIPKVKYGLSFFPRELMVSPRIWAKTLGDVVYESYNSSGGHFAAWEKPAIIAQDLQKMFGKKGPCYGIVKGKAGYRDDRRQQANL